VTALADASAYTVEDLLNTIRNLGVWWMLLLEDIADPHSDPQLGALLAEQQAALASFAASVDLPASLLQMRLDVEDEFSLASSLLRKRITAHSRGSSDAVLNESLVLLHEAGARVRLLRAPSQITGVVHGCFTSGGGVPKFACDELVVTTSGAVGDVQKTRKHHGRPWQAMCLWSSDVVRRLADEGHPIEPGFAGENISIAGLDWSEVRPGSQLRIGSVLLETSLYALPCAKNAAWFKNRDFERMHHRREIGVSRLYASVLQPGTLRTGDPVALNS
jgi:hypothetical protein